MRALLIVVAGLSWGALAAPAATPVGKVESLEGSALAESAGGERPLAVGDDINLKEKVRTGSGAKIQLRFVDGTTIAQGERAELVIDEYLFNPQVKEENKTLFRFVRGVFRVITDQIARMNPEEFKVRTNYGTIGIRGCDLVFKVQDDTEEVFIAGLHESNTVVVTADKTGTDR
jgi:hypothetical protein